MNILDIENGDSAQASNMTWNSATGMLGKEIKLNNDFEDISCYARRRWSIELFGSSENKLSVNNYLKNVLGNAPSLYFNFDALCEVCQRAEMKLNNLYLAPTQRIGAICAYRPEGVWAKPASRPVSLPIFLMIRGEKHWCLVRDVRFKAEKVRGEQLILTKKQAAC